jgi:hypothetical protein
MKRDDIILKPMVGNDEYYFYFKILKMLGRLSDFIMSAILDYELSLIYYMVYGPEFWNYHDASMTRKELIDIIFALSIL